MELRRHAFSLFLLFGTIVQFSLCAPPPRFFERGLPPSLRHDIGDPTELIRRTRQEMLQAPITAPTPAPAPMAPPPPAPAPAPEQKKARTFPVSLEVIPIKETTAGIYQTKFKFYIKHYCPKGGAAVEFQNQQVEGVGRVKVVDVDSGQEFAIPYHGTSGWVNLPRICFKDNANNPVYYKILVDNRPIGWFSCVTLPDGRMLTEIRGPDNIGSKYYYFADQGGTGLKWNMGDYTIGLEAIKESTGGISQSKFKIYLQKNDWYSGFYDHARRIGSLCGPKGDATIEFQNQQAEGVGRVKVVNVESGQEFGIPYHGASGWVNLPPICFKDVNNPVYYKILVDNGPIGWFSCVTLPDGRMLTEIRGANNVGSRYYYFSDQGGTGLKWNMGDYTIGLEAVKELTGSIYQSKFKIYLQKNDWGSGFYDHARQIGSLCRAGIDMQVEIQNQRTTSSITVLSLPDRRTFNIPAQGTSGFTVLGKVCPDEVAYYKIIWQGRAVGWIRCTFSTKGEGYFQIAGPRGDNAVSIGNYKPFNGERMRHILLNVGGVNYSLGVVLVKEGGQSKLKIYFQKNWGEEGERYPTAWLQGAMQKEIGLTPDQAGALMNF